MAVEKPTKCVSSRKLIEINAQIQFIDFEGRSDGESMLKILSQLRPRRVIVVRGLPQSAETVARHCQQNIGARVFTPQKGEVSYCDCQNSFNSFNQLQMLQFMFYSFWWLGCRRNNWNAYLSSTTDWEPRLAAAVSARERCWSGVGWCCDRCP